MAETVTLRNAAISVAIASETGALTAATNLLTQETWKVKAVPFSIETTQGAIEAGPTVSHQAGAAEAAFVFNSPHLAVTVRYRLGQDAGYVVKTIEVRNAGQSPVQLERLTSDQWEMAPSLREIHAHRDPSEFRWLINLFLRGEMGGFYCGIENPVYEYVSKGSTPGSSYLALSYAPRKILQPGESYVSDATFLGSYRMEKIYVFKELGKLRQAVNAPKAIPSMLNFDQEILDWGEVWAMQDYIRSRQPPHDAADPGFYVRAVAMVGGNRTSALDKEAGFHIPFAPQHVAGSERFIDEVAALGHIPHIEWAVEWFGNGGYANPTPGLALENATGEEVPPNTSWLEVVRYGWGKGLRTGIFETASRNFARSKAEWKVLLPDGKPWTWGKEELPVNCWANREYAQWRLDVTDRAVRDYKLYMTAWDAIVPADWSWLGWPDVRMECYAKNHGHPPGDIRYAAFRNILWFLDQLQQRNPRLAMRVASGLTTAYPWALKNLIEYHPDFYDGETGATYWTSYNFRFLPMYKSGVLLSGGKKEDFEWLLLRSISVSDHFMLWPDAVGIATEDKAFWDKWLHWADENIRYLRVGRTLFREPWGDQIVASLPPALEGSLPAPAAALHGSAHIIGDRGYLFLFNPSHDVRVAEVPINSWIGLSEGKTFEIRTMHPSAGTTYGPYERGETLRIAVPARGSLVLEVRTATEKMARLRPRAPLGAPVDKAFLTFDEIPWKEIAVRP